jgi:hypothetical protein
MKRFFFGLSKHAVLVQLLLVLAVILAIFLAGAAPNALDP